MNETRKKPARRGSLQRVVVCSLLAALSIVCGKFLQLPVGEFLRFSLENLPILMAAALFGPGAGLLVGVTADLVGCLLVGYVINPLVTLGAAAVGLAGGFVYRLAGRFSPVWRIVLMVAAAHIVGSVIVKSFGLAQFYDLPFGMLLLWRLLNYTLVGSAEAFLLHLLLRQPGIRRLLIPCEASIPEEEQI